MKPADRSKSKKNSNRSRTSDADLRNTTSADSNELAARELAAHTATLVLVPELRTQTISAEHTPASPEARLDEARGLAAAIDLDIHDAGIVPVSNIAPATLFGSGKVDELKGIIHAEEIDLVIVDHPLSPGQQRNLERAWRAKVLDRTGLILEIFGRRARTAEGRLQVELAHLTWQKSRLVRSWTHLERQRGGFGFLGGPGETQIEADRRQIQDRIRAIKTALAKVSKTRALHRKSRARVPYPVVALVGYTNAGKSTLFNRLTGAGVMARDQLFATLDPTMREVSLPSGRKLILSDTVGFISDLPLMLVAAFRATLEEVVSADIILHVRDIASPDSVAQKANVEDVLRQLGVDAELVETNLVEVWNKLDLLDETEAAAVAAQAARLGKRVVSLSARTGQGVEMLVETLDELLAADALDALIEINPEAGGFTHWLYENAEVLARDDRPSGGTVLQVRVPRIKADAFHRKLAGAQARLIDKQEE